MALKRILSILVSLALLVFIASDGLAQRSVGVRARQSPGAEKRVALVIGNANYGRSMGRLINPANDAVDMATALSALGFQVTHLKDLNREGFEDALDNFTETARGSAVALFYFAGHGVQVNQVNYLVPIGARLKKQLHAKYRAVPANLVVDSMQASGARANIVILDACRNNPLPKSGRSAAKGLASMAPGSGTLIAFAAGPGQEADENSRGRNGLYTQELLKNMRTPGISIIEVFQRTRQEVHRRSRNKQTPQDWNSLVGKSIYLAGATPSSPPAAIAREQPRRAPEPLPALEPRKSINAEETLWKTIDNSTDIEDFQDYLSAYPSGRFAVTARIKIRRIKRQRQKKEDQNRRLAEERRRLEAERRMAEERRRREAERSRLAEERRRRIEEEERRRAAIRRDVASRKWRDPVTGMQFVKVTGGSFQRGCHASEGNCRSNEKPLRTVRLDGFWLGKYEVTVGQFRQFVNDTGFKTKAESGGCWVYKKKWIMKSGITWRNQVFRQGSNHPVACVTWNEAQAFAKWLSRKTGQRFRLPSGAQWEYACRSGGRSIKYGTGNGRLSSGNANYNETNKGTTPVGRYRPNRLGLYDMSGNLSEWVADKYTKDYKKVGTINPIYKGSGIYRAYRGGSWYFGTRNQRCSFRYRDAPYGRHEHLGFRLLRVP